MLAEEYADGVELVGGEIGLHYDAEGRLIFLYGAQFEAVDSVSAPAILDRASAYTMAQDLVTTVEGFVAADRSEWPPEAIERQMETSELLLVSTGDGRTFRYMWQVPTLDASGNGFAILMDAATAEIVAVESTDLHDVTVPPEDCPPQSSNVVSARLYPELPQAACSSGCDWYATSTRNPKYLSYPYEAHFPGDAAVGQPSTHVPPIEVYFGWWTTADLCPATVGQKEAYEVLPLQANKSAVVEYKEYPDPDSEFPMLGYMDDGVPGHLAADAMMNTYRTMYMFHEHLDRYGFNGEGGTVARVTVRALCPANQARFYRGVWNTHSPEYSVALCQQDANALRSPSAALDIVAHEWGHGVVDDELALGTQYEAGEINEGFADVYGHMAEHYADTLSGGWLDPGRPVDWHFGEDRGWCNDTGCTEAYSRSAEDYQPSRWSWHASENLGEVHRNGNRLAVAFRLLAEGGQNPACNGLTWDPPCSGLAVTGLGFDKASKIMHRAMTYGSSTLVWEDLPWLAYAAANHMYLDCDPPYGCQNPQPPTCGSATSGPAEMAAAVDAFRAIGYDLVVPGGSWLYVCAACECD